LNGHETEVTLKGQTRDPNRPVYTAQYLENGWITFRMTTNRK